MTAADSEEPATDDGRRGGDGREDAVGVAFDDKIAVVVGVWGVLSHDAGCRHGSEDCCNAINQSSAHCSRLEMYYHVQCDCV